MLQTFRERLQGWLVILIVTFLVLGLGLFGLQNYWAPGASDVLATINGYKIHASQFNRVYEPIRLRAIEFNLNESAQAALKKQTLQALIKKQVELSAAMKSGMTLSPQQLEAVVYSMPFFQEKGIFSYPKFQKFLSVRSQSEAGFLSEVREFALLEQLKMGILGSAFTLKNEVTQAIALSEQKRVFEYLLIPHAAFASKNMPTSESIQAYYASHQAEFKTSERVKVDYLALVPEEIKKRVSVSDSEIKNYYEENKTLYKEKSLETAEVKDQIKQILLSEKLQTMMSTLSDQLAELTYIHPDNLDAAAKALQLPVKTSDFFSKSGMGTGWFSDAAVLQAAFAPEVLTQGRNSDVLRLKDGTLLVLREKQHEPSKILLLDTVRNQIISILTIQKSREEAQKVGQEWLAHLKEGKTIQPVVQTRKFPWKSVKAKSSTKVKSVNPDILKIAFDMPSMTTKPGKFVYSGKSLPNGDFVLIKLIAVELGEVDALSPEALKDFEKKLRQEDGQLDYDFYVEGLLKQAKIKLK